MTLWASVTIILTREKGFKLMTDGKVSEQVTKFRFLRKRSSEFKNEMDCEQKTYSSKVDIIKDSIKTTTLT